MKIFKYDNGATLIYHHKKTADVTDATIGFCCGSKCDGKHPGISHFLEHMLVSDTDKMSRDEVHKLIDMTDTYQNAFTSKDAIALTFNCPSMHFGTLLSLNSNFIFRTHFDEKLMKAEIRPIMEELNMSKDDENLDLAIEMMTGSILSSYIIGTKDSITSEYILGSEESLQKITTKDFFDYMNKYFVSENLIISIVSSLPFEEVQSKVDKYLISKIKSNPENKVTTKPTRYNFIRKDKLIINQDDIVKNNTFELTFFFRNNLSNDLENRKYSMLERWLFNNETGKLSKLFREKHGLTYTSYFTTQDLGNLHLKCLNIKTSPKKVHQAIKTTVNMLDDIITNGITDDDLAQFYMKIKSKQQRIPKLSDEKSRNLFFEYLYDELPDNKNIYEEILKLTKEDVNKYLKYTYGMSNVGIILNGNTLKAQNILTDQELQEEQNKILNEPYVVPDEVVTAKFEEKIYEIITNVNPLPTMNEILAGFKLGNKIIAEFEKKMIIPYPYVLSNENKKIKRSNVNYSDEAKKALDIKDDELTQ